MFTIPDELGISDTGLTIDFIKEVVGEMEIGPLMVSLTTEHSNADTAYKIPES